MGNGLIDWSLDDFVKNNDFETNWFNWYARCKNTRKTLAGNLDSMVLRLKITRFLFGPLILVTYSLVFEFWKNCKLVLEA
jgi:hypothetical protein